MSLRVSLFVYGSFSQGMVHFNKLTEYIKNSKPAKAKGSVFRLQVGYPVYHNQGEQWIEGQLVELEGPDVFFKILDEFHGCLPNNPDKSLFHKMNVEVWAEGDSVPQTVQTYSVNRAKLPKKAQLIIDGDWKKSLENTPALTQTLTDRQKTYVKKLGASTGREIVPINLEMYRELMKLDLIVDKGRRLALSKLGKEVFKYLE